MNKIESAIEVQNLTKSFRIPLDKSPNLKQKIFHGFRGKGYREFSPLKDVSLTINRGDFFGIVGKNGSGKSTLLKTIAGIYTPDSGGVKVNGLLIPFIELGVGFNPELSGRENVFLNGALLGFSRREIEVMYEDIVDFAELHDFMEERLKNYSSGMQVRLAFSIAIRAKGDILLLDEVLAVGDAAFQQKCYDYFATLKESGRTVILVTHSMSIVHRFCTRAALLHEGQLAVSGDVDSVTKEYERLNAAKDAPAKKQETKYLSGEHISYLVTLTDQQGREKTNFKPDDRINIHLSLEPKTEIKNAFIGVTIQKANGDYVFWKTTEEEEITFHKGRKINLHLDIQNVFGEDQYRVNLIVRSNDRTLMYLEAEKVARFNIRGWGRNGWMLHPDNSMEIKE
jgi:ABC-2 type transport system ATP-binding protein